MPRRHGHYELSQSYNDGMDAEIKQNTQPIGDMQTISYRMNKAARMNSKVGGHVQNTEDDLKKSFILHGQLQEHLERMLTLHQTTRSA